MAAMELRGDMPMRLIVRTAAMVVTSGIAVTALLAGPHGGIPAWGTGLVLSIVLLAVAAGAALDIAEWKDAQRGGRPRAATRLASASGMTPAPMPRAAGLTPGSAAAVARTGALPMESQAAWAAVTPLWPLRVCFTLRYKTSSEVLARAFSTASTNASGSSSGGAAVREAMTREALDEWLARYSGFGEWPIKRPVEMTVEVDFRESAAGCPRGVVRFQRVFSDGPLEVKSVSRVEDRLFQDNDVSGWVMSNRTGTAWTVADLEHATIRVKAVYLSFDDEDFQQPPRFETLHLCFGDPARSVFSFTATQLATPSICEDPAPLMRGPFFKTLLLEYELSLTGIALAEQLVPLRSQAN
jgi:hypothetical protein